MKKIMRLKESDIARMVMESVNELNKIMKAKKKPSSIVKVQNEEHLMRLLEDGNEHFFHPALRKNKSAEIRIHLGKTIGDKLMWFVYYDETDEQQEFDKDESLVGEQSWLKPILERGSLYCKIDSE